jgi:uncharacterized membrane protein YozB (DUF420 family)
MNALELLPPINASLNGLSGILLIVGIALIKSERKQAHGMVMGAAFAVSCIFLVCYVWHKFELRAATGAWNTKFPGPQPWKTLYLVMLATHVLLAMAVPPLAIVTMRRALIGHYEAHRKLAKITFPIWFYVSVTGVLVYFFLYRWFPAK